VRKELDAYLRGSGFPEYWKFGPEIVRTIYEDVVLKDCIRRYGVRAEGVFRELARYLVSNFSCEFTHSRLARVVGVKDVHTVGNYLTYLRNAFLIHVVERFSPKLKQRILAPKKVYVIDHGLANFVGLAREVGRLYENVVCCELLRRASERYGTEVCYWKDHRGREVNFVVVRGGEVEQLIQVCYELSREEVRKRELSALGEASRELRCRNLLVLTGEKEGRRGWREEG
jgi:predicted AAA+ superfamily ATPase